MKGKEEYIAHAMRYCQHYDASGVTMIGGKEPHGYCKAGIIYLDQFGRAPRGKPGSYLSDGSYYQSAGIFRRMCCIDGGKRTEEEQRALCPKWLRCTREQGEAEYAETVAAINRMTVVGPVVAEWREKPPIGKAEVIECPVCKGRLHLSQSAYNGHVHGHCETVGCVSWME